MSWGKRKIGTDWKHSWDLRAIYAIANTFKVLIALRASLTPTFPFPDRSLSGHVLDLVCECRLMLLGTSILSLADWPKVLGVSSQSISSQQLFVGGLPRLIPLLAREIWAADAGERNVSGKLRPLKETLWGLYTSQTKFPKPEDVSELIPDSLLIPAKTLHSKSGYTKKKGPCRAALTRMWSSKSSKSSNKFLSFFLSPSTLPGCFCCFP